MTLKGEGGEGEKGQLKGTTKNIFWKKQVIQGRDCSSIWQKNKKAAFGVYLIKPDGANSPFQVYCEITKSGGWTRIQFRNGLNGVTFNRTWSSYEQGFGNVSGEHWLGLKNMNILTNQKNRQCKLRINLQDFSNATAYAQYDTFNIGPNSTFYPLTVGKYSGTAGDAFKGTLASENQYGRAFSTQDISHDGCTPKCHVDDMLFKSCSQRVQSGWWFNACGLANLNGKYFTPPNHLHQTSFLSWPTWRFYESLKSTTMSVICN
ncbi:fibrinogen-like protein 1 [Aquarana catesbeiana]|uniref:fibrinogen-like protein 1 n=1 Tax=Aquarana catesbeiana TaxID=8400 RepID=UPI003CC99D70